MVTDTMDELTEYYGYNVDFDATAIARKLNRTISFPNPKGFTGIEYDLYVLDIVTLSLGQHCQTLFV